jgi:hypothetical protein
MAQKTTQGHRTTTETLFLMTTQELNRALDLVEAVESSSIDDQISAWQELVNTGLVWQLQGWYGRTAEQLIAEGIIQPRKQNHG